MSILNFFSSPKEPAKPAVPAFNLLVIDDNKELIETLSQVKMPMQIKVIFSSNAQEAISILKNNQIHAILSDIQMADMELLNYELNKLFSEIPVFRMSGSHTAFPNLMLTKPFSISEYKNTLIQLYGLGKESQKAA